MALVHQSIATISSPQFINLEPLDINPFMSSCQIKVLYIGENRNRTFISKQVATEMSKTLRGAPIVGYYKKDKQDFTDHGEQVILDDQGIHFNCLTKPYGFVAPDAKIWFQDFEDIDDFGNSIIRTYLMTQGYLWTGQFKQAQQIINNNGKPQSMELESESVKGYWSTNIKKDMDFFIINDAIFSKLCILGDDVEPCFQGASIKPTSYTLDNTFKKTLSKMMEQLTYALKGGNVVSQANKNIQDNIDENVSENFELNKDDINKDVSENFQKEQDNIDENVSQNFELNKDDKTEDESSSSFVKKVEQESTEDEDKDKDKEDKTEQKYTLLKEQFENLQNSYSELEKELKVLKDFKNEILDKEKDELIDQFYMLSDDDKEDIIKNKDKYTLEEIESKLSVICFRKKVNLSSVKPVLREECPVVTFNVDNKEDSTPDWVKAVEVTMKNRI